jgi:hypothetical protein
VWVDRFYDTKKHRFSPVVIHLLLVMEISHRRFRKEADLLGQRQIAIAFMRLFTKSPFDRRRSLTLLCGCKVDSDLSSHVQEPRRKFMAKHNEKHYLSTTLPQTGDSQRKSEERIESQTYDPST